jgi:hypothetical protein
LKKALSISTCHWGSCTSAHSHPFPCFRIGRRKVRKVATSIIFTS